MQILFVILAALAPVVVALGYIYKKDAVQPEPTKWLLKAFWFGVLSTFLSFVFSTPIEEIFGLSINAEVYASIFESFTDAFLLAAIPEELAKFVMLWLLLRKNPHFDEKFDGIVYAVCIGMGFAGLENVMYLFSGLEDGSWIGIGISRALTSIPGHFFFAVLMGYYYSLWYWRIDRSPMTKVMILAAPILAHGIYDGILFSMRIDEGIAGIGMFVFLYFLNKLRKKAKERINRLENQ